MTSSFYVVNFSHNFRQWRLKYYIFWMIESTFWITQTRATLRPILGTILSRQILICEKIFHVILSFLQSRFFCFSNDFRSFVYYFVFLMKNWVNCLLFHETSLNKALSCKQSRQIFSTITKSEMIFEGEVSTFLS